MEYLFSYGTLQKERVQLELFGRLLTGTPDSLQGYRTSQLEITDQRFLSRGEQKHQLTAVRSDEKDSIKGTVFEISADELARSDEYEPEGYERIEVRVESGKKAWLYLLAETA